MKRLTPVLMAAALFVTAVSPVSAYNHFEFGSMRFSQYAIGDNNISVCHGEQSTDGIYYHRARLAEELELTWGSIFGVYGGDIDFSSNGLCNNDGSELWIVWDRTLDCPQDEYGYLDYFVPLQDGWDAIVMKLNAECNIEGVLDWILSDGIQTGKLSARRLVAHEAGHAFGLDHSTAASTLMWDGSPTSCPLLGWHARTTGDDRSGVVARYPEYEPVSLGPLPRTASRSRSDSHNWSSSEALRNRPAPPAARAVTRRKEGAA